VFGTFRNPESVDGVQAGFYNGASARILDMLLFRDVSRPPQDEEVALQVAAPANRAA
jgi:hypothetical protein